MKLQKKINLIQSKMKLGEISIGAAMLQFVKLAKETNSDFSPEFLDASSKEGNRLIDVFDRTFQHLCIKKMLEKPFGSLLDEDNPPPVPAEKED